MFLSSIARPIGGANSGRLLGARLLSSYSSGVVGLRMLMRSSIAACAFGAAMLAAAAAAMAAEIRVFSSGAPAEVEKAVAATFTQATGHRVVFTVATPAEIQARLKGGETPDIVILPAPI